VSALACDLKIKQQHPLCLDPNVQFGWLAGNRKVTVEQAFGN
jgi:hypothetical protein